MIGIMDFLLDCMDFIELMYLEFLTFFNDISLYLTNETIFHNFFYLSAYFLIICANIIYFLIWMMRFYRIFCFSKLTFDALPMINPYLWPFSVFRVYTEAYFSFWLRLIPPIQYGRTSFDISIVLGIEALTSITYLLSQSRYYCIILAGQLLSNIN